MRGCWWRHPVAAQLNRAGDAGTDRKISYWDAYNGSAIRILEPNTSDILGWVAISASGSWLVTGKPRHFACDLQGSEEQKTASPPPAFCLVVLPQTIRTSCPLRLAYRTLKRADTHLIAHLPRLLLSSSNAIHLKFQHAMIGWTHSRTWSSAWGINLLEQGAAVLQVTPHCECGTTMRGPVQLCWMAMGLRSKPSPSPQMTAISSQWMAVAACLSGQCQLCEAALHSAVHARQR